MSTNPSKQALTLLSLPPEIHLSILSQIPYDPSFMNLRLINRSFSNIIQTYKQSLCLQVASSQHLVDNLARFPGLYTPDTTISFRILNELHQRTYILQRIQRSSERLRMCCCKQAAWMRPEWISLQSAGLHLLYRLQDTASHAAKEDLITTLPTTSLAILLFTIHLCLHHLRAIGPRIVSVPNSTTTAYEIDLATQELIFQHGPLFLDCLLCHCPHAIKKLEDEVENMERRQMPDEQGRNRPRTLVAVSRSEMGGRLEGKGWGEGMWEIVREVGGLGEGGIDRIVRGEEVVGLVKKGG